MTAQRQLGGADVGPVRAHFLNNVLATAASYVDEDPDLARDLLADLGAFLAYRLREDLEPVPLRDELDFVRTYLRLEAARHGDRLEVRVDDPGAEAASAPVAPVALQALVEDLLTARLRDDPGPVRVAVRPAPDGAQVRVDLSRPPGGEDPERVVAETGGQA